jgi:glycosyltransferase involved in cell wall biosynthesis
MRILIAHNRYTQPGGEDNVFEAETALLRAHGEEVYTWEEHNDRIKEVSPIRAATATVWSSASQKSLAELLARYRPEVVHFHNTFLRISPAAYYTCQEFGIPVIQTLHNYRLICPAATLLRDGAICEDCLGKWGLWPSIQHSCWHSSRAQTAVVTTMLATHRLLQTWQKQVNFYVVLTEFARQKFIAGGLPAEKIVVKPNFIPTALLESAIHSVRSNHALYVGRLAPEKGVKLLLEAWQDMAGIPLKIVGDGPSRAELEAFAKQAGLNQVEFCGSRSQQEVFELMQEARMLIVPSIWYEGLPLTVIEAFSHHLPVIVSKLGAMAELVQHGRNGLHFQVNDVADLVRSVRWAWEHPDDMAHIANQAYQDFLEKYSAPSNYRALMEIYQRAIAG